MKTLVDKLLSFKNEEKNLNEEKNILQFCNIKYLENENECKFFINEDFSPVWFKPNEKINSIKLVEKKFSMEKLVFEITTENTSEDLIENFYDYLTNELEKYIINGSNKIIGINSINLDENNKTVIKKNFNGDDLVEKITILIKNIKKKIINTNNLVWIFNNIYFDKIIKFLNNYVNPKCSRLMGFHMISSNHLTENDLIILADLKNGYCLGIGEKETISERGKNFPYFTHSLSLPLGGLVVDPQCFQFLKIEE